MTTFADLARKKPVSERLRVYLDDGEAATGLAKAQSVLFTAEKRLEVVKAAADRAAAQATVAAAREEVAAAEQLAEENSVEAVFVAMSRRAYEDLLDAYPPTEEQVKDAKDAGRDPPSFDAEAFPVALVSESCADPKMTVDEVRELFETWTAAEALTLANAAFRVNSGRRVVELGKGR